MSNKKNTKYFKTSKAFLSPHYDENSTVSWHVEVGNCQVGADLILRDCYKRIDLNFWTDDGPYDITTRLLKISVLIDELILFKKSLKEAHAVFLLFKPFEEAKKHEKKEEAKKHRGSRSVEEVIDAL